MRMTRAQIKYKDPKGDKGANAFVSLFLENLINKKDLWIGIVEVGP